MSTVSNSKYGEREHDENTVFTPLFKAIMALPCTAIAVFVLTLALPADWSGHSKAAVIGAVVVVGFLSFLIMLYRAVTRRTMVVLLAGMVVLGIAGWLMLSPLYG